MEREVQLIRECQRGSYGAFGGLYEAYAEKIYNFIFYRTFNKERAEDITSVTFMKALENIEQFDIRKGAFSSWLYRIAQNTLIDQYRAEKPTANIEDFFDIGEDISYSEHSDTKRKLDEVREYLKKLTKEQQEIIRLRVWDGLSYKEIAEITGKSEGSCKVMFSRIVAKIREDMPHALLLFALMRISIER